MSCHCTQATLSRNCSDSVPKAQLTSTKHHLALGLLVHNATAQVLTDIKLTLCVVRLLAAACAIAVFVPAVAAAATRLLHADHLLLCRNE